MVKSIYSFEFVKIVFFIFSKILLQAYALAMALKSLMYKSVLFDENDSELLHNVIDLYFRGLTKGAATVTFTHTALVLPLSIIIVLYLPTVIFILLLNCKNSRKNMDVTDTAVLFIFPIFTSLCFHKTAFEKNGKSGRSNTHDIFIKRSKSLPNIFATNYKPKLKRRTKSAINLAFSVKKELTAQFSLLHSNILYVMFVLGNALVVGVDIVIQIHRNPSRRLSSITGVFLVIFILNILLWIDFNYNRRRKHRASRVMR